MNRNPNHILFGVTSSVSVGFFDGQLRDLQGRGWICTVAASPDIQGQLDSFSATEGVAAVPLQMEREISLVKDLRSLWLALRILAKTRPAIVIAGTPKAGLILSLAGAITRVPLRVYALYGLRLETATGLRRVLLTLTEKISMASAHKVLCVSPSLRDRVLELRLTKADKLAVNGRGSVNGVAIPEGIERLASDRQVIGFVGRLTRDKGVEHLVDAFNQIKEEFPDAQLLLIGGPDTADALPASTLRKIHEDPRIQSVGRVPDLSPYYRQMTVFVLPSLREGLPTVLLEAAAHAVPVIASDATGAKDGVVDGETGWLVATGDASSIADALRRCFTAPESALAMGFAGREWVSRNYSRAGVWQDKHEFYVDAMYERARRRHIPALRVLDVAGATVGLLVAAIPAAFVGLAVRHRLGSPILFRQVRPGRDGTPFTLVKFRTMTEETDLLGRPLSDVERLTPFGELLRRTSLDELPSLWNVLRGEMSLVGPRPLLTRYTAYFSDRERLRLAVRPGLTGWAQTNGRNTASWDERLGSDAWYVVNRGVALYLRILMRTFTRVVRGTGVVPDAESIMDNLDVERRESQSGSSQTRV